MERFGKPGKTLLGSDSHTPAAGAIGMLSMGAGGLEIAFVLAGERYYLPMPEVWGIELSGKLPDWVSAKDVVLEMLRRYDVDNVKTILRGLQNRLSTEEIVQAFGAFGTRTCLS